MEAHSIWTSRDACKETDQSIVDYSPLAQAGNGDKSGCLSHEEIMGPIPRTDFMTSFKTELDRVIKQVQAAGNAQAKRARELQESHEAEKTTLEVKLREKEKALLEKDSIIKKLQEGLPAKVQELENQLCIKEALLRSRDIELEGLQAKISSLTTHVTELETAIGQMESTTASEAQRTEELKKRYAVLEAALRDTKERETSAARQLRAGFDAKVRKLEGELQVKDQLLRSRESELKQKELSIKAKEEEAVKFSESRSRLIQKLIAELKEKKIALASYERSHWRSIGRRNWWKRMFQRTPLSLAATAATSLSRHPETHEIQDSPLYPTKQVRLRLQSRKLASFTDVPGNEG